MTTCATRSHYHAAMAQQEPEEVQAEWPHDHRNDFSMTICAPCSHYHAAMTQQEREEVQANWTHDRMQIIVATIAFGMGESSACTHHAAPDIPIHGLVASSACSSSAPPDRMQMIMATTTFSMGVLSACVCHAAPDIPAHAESLIFLTAHTRFLWAALPGDSQAL